MRKVAGIFLITSIFLACQICYVMAASPIVIRLWEQNDYRIAGLQPSIDLFNRTNPDVQIELERKDPNANNLLPAVAAGVGPNVIVGASSRDRDFFDLGILADLRPYINRDNFSLDDYFPATLDFGQAPSGELFSMPLDSQVIVMYYNPEVLARNGLQPPQPGWRNSVLRNMTTKLRQRDAQGQLTQHAIIGKHPNHVGMYFMGQNNGYIINLVNGIECTVNKPAFRQAYTIIDELISEVRLRVEGVHSGVTWNIFLTGQAGFYMDGNFRLFDLTNQMNDVVTAPLLYPDSGAQPGSYLWTRTLALVISGNPEVDEAAWRVLKFLSSVDALTLYVVNARLLPVTKGSIAHPLFREYVREFGVNLDLMANYYLPAGSGKTEMASPRSDTIRGIWGSLQTRFMRGEIPLSTFIDELDHQVQLIVQEILTGKQ